MLWFNFYFGLKFSNQFNFFVSDYGNESETKENKKNKTKTKQKQNIHNKKKLLICI